MSQHETTPPEEQHHQPEESIYRIRFRDDGQEYTALSQLEGLARGDNVMVKTDHGLEPARIFGSAPAHACRCQQRKASYEIARLPTAEEDSRYYNLFEHEQAAFEICGTLIDKHALVMSLVRVEKYFNGSKMIFYFTADNRVDFRGLVKDLVQEFRTRVEMRQVGVRHETKMLGGLGICGRELCCSSFMKTFDSVSIKMAKEQDLPLNPAKISGVCNRLLCCLTYEYETYRCQRREMPKVGRKVKLGEEIYRVKRQNPLQQSIIVISSDGEEKLLQKREWSAAEQLKADKKTRKNGGRPESDSDTDSAGEEQ